MALGVLETVAAGSSRSATGFGAAVVLALLCYLLARAFWSWNRLRHIPGPPLASVSAAWMLRKLASGRFHTHMYEVSEKYGAY